MPSFPTRAAGPLHAPVLIFACHFFFLLHLPPPQLPAVSLPALFSTFSFLASPLDPKSFFLYWSFDACILNTYTLISHIDMRKVMISLAMGDMFLISQNGTLDFIFSYFCISN